MSGTERERMTLIVSDAFFRGNDIATALIAEGFGDVTSLTAERDALAAKVAAVEALCAKWLQPYNHWSDPWFAGEAAEEIRAAMLRSAAAYLTTTPTHQ